MIDQQLKEHVTTQVNAVKAAQGDFESVIRRGETRRRTTLGLQTAAAVVFVLGFVGIISQVSPEQAAVSGNEPAPDLRVIVNSGEGAGSFADDLARSIGPDVIAGSAVHVGWVETPHGRFDLVTFPAVGEDPRRPESELSTCVGATSAASTPDTRGFSTGWCSPESELAVLSRGYGRHAFYWNLDRVPGDTARVLVTTSQEKRIEVITSDYVFATWPTSWGPPETMITYDAAGNQTGSITYEDA